MKILFIGGSGNISSYCTNEALKLNHEVLHFNRGQSANSDLIQNITVIQGDINSTTDRKKIRDNGPYDVAANFIGFVPEQIEADVELFSDICDQYIFISSATVYQKPPEHYIIKESSLLSNPYWEYARNKIACEQVLHNQDKLKYTIVRPSYTYGKSWIPVALTARSYSPVHRIKNGLPIISHGDGESLWVNTHASDFARAFVGLFGNQAAINTDFHITSDEVLTWDAIYRTIGELVDREPYLIHIPSDFIHRYAPDWGDGLLGDKARSAVFDNTKIKNAVPGWKAEKSFAEGIKESIQWFEAESSRMQLNPDEENMIDLIIGKYQSVK